MHLLVILAAMLFAAATPYLSIPEGRDVELSDNASPSPGSPDDNPADDALSQDESGEDERGDA